jgi:hypothetical protein
MPDGMAPLLLAAAVGSGLAAVVNGAVRSTGRGRLQWLGVGVAVGTMLALAAGVGR